MKHGNMNIYCWLQNVPLPFSIGEGRSVRQYPRLAIQYHIITRETNWKKLRNYTEQNHGILIEFPIKRKL
ncbi:hypothetical protein MKW98_029966 [Papaver atlanticum]|uniref:Uncharacterized protein n=1 Tax=Papaver atlanticum TaxID=357466 RepID=A0AAD4TM09_9MAGN|nr:hypothetical protein MKW98_029966 [Papaver atlanticum]